MTQDEGSTSTTEIENRLQHVGLYSSFVKAGLGVILGSFVLATVALLLSLLRLEQRYCRFAALSAATF